MPAIGPGLPREVAIKAAGYVRIVVNGLLVKIPFYRLNQKENTHER